MKRFLLSVAILGLLVVPVQGAHHEEASIVKEPRGLVGVTGKALLTETFSAKKIPARYAIAKGTWAIDHGALKGVELAADQHAASIRTNMDFHNVVATFDFKFDGGKTIHFSVNGKTGHICRVTITPGGFTVRRDKNKKLEGDKPVVFGSAEKKFEAGKWYTMVVDIQGDTMLARVDRSVVFGSDAGVNVAKTNFGFPIAGDSASIDNVGIYESTPNPKWKAIEAGLEKRLSD